MYASCDLGECAIFLCASLFYYCIYVYRRLYVVVAVVLSWDATVISTFDNKF